MAGTMMDISEVLGKNGELSAPVWERGPSS